MILAIVYVQVTSILQMNFESVALSVQEKKFKTDFQDGYHDNNLHNDLSYFLSTSHLDAYYQVSSQMDFQFRRRKEK